MKGILSFVEHISIKNFNKKVQDLGEITKECVLVLEKSILWNLKC